MGAGPELGVCGLNVDAVGRGLKNWVLLGVNLNWIPLCVALEVDAVGRGSNLDGHGLGLETIGCGRNLDGRGLEVGAVVFGLDVTQIWMSMAKIWMGVA